MPSFFFDRPERTPGPWRALPATHARRELNVAWRVALTSLALLSSLGCSSGTTDSDAGPGGGQCQTCETLGCGYFADNGCGQEVNCGPCNVNGTGGTPTSGECQSCDALGCGYFADNGCGEAVNCGPCTPGGGGDSDPAPTDLPTEGIAFGTAPSTVSASDAQSAYSTFKSKFLETQSCTRVRFGTGSSETVSEGIGYGMLLAAAHNDKTTFDGLNAYYKAAVAAGGGSLMPWKVSGCGPNVVDSTPASDADLDVAMALIMAECRWGATYAADASRVINAVEVVAVSAYGDGYVLFPGYPSPSDVNPSYFSPAYYRAFAYHEPDRAGVWMALAEHTYATLAAGTNASTGLVPDWMTPTGGPSPIGNHSYDYKYDACRTPWRIGMDYLWWGEPMAKTYLDKVTGWVSTIQPQNIADGYTVGGSAFSYNNNESFVGAFAVGAIASNGSTANSYFSHLKSMNTGDYYPTALKAVYLAVGAGLMAACPGG